MLKDEAALTNYLKTKINDHSLEEVVYIILATLLAIGILSAVARATKQTEWLEALSCEVLNEVPRAIYFFGSSITGALIATAIFMYNRPAVKVLTVNVWIIIATGFGIGAFLYGCLMSYAFKRTTHIK